MPADDVVVLAFIDQLVLQSKRGEHYGIGEGCII